MAQRQLTAATDTRQPFPFLLLPAELRNRVYNGLHRYHRSNFDRWICGRVQVRLPVLPILPRSDDWFTDTCSRQYVRLWEHPDTVATRCSDADTGCLWALMRANRLVYSETIALLYSALKFLLTPSLPRRPRPLQLDGQVQIGHLRQVRIPVRVVFHKNSIKAQWDTPEPMFRFLSQEATQLERLELDVYVSYTLVRIREDVINLIGRPTPAPRFCWSDPLLMQSPPASGAASENPRRAPCLTGEQLSPILEFLAPGDKSLQLTIRREIEGSLQGVQEPHGISWCDIWGRLRELDGYSVFLGRTLMDIFKVWNAALRVVVVIGPVDREWMTAVADLANVTVQAKKHFADPEWLTVRPAGASIEGGCRAE